MTTCRSCPPVLLLILKRMTWVWPRKTGEKAASWELPHTMLRLNSKQECIDKAEILDKAAPGGGYMFCMDKSILSLADAKPENLIAVCEFVTSMVFTNRRER